MKLVESKDLIVGRKYADISTNSAGMQCILEFSEFTEDGCILMKYISGFNAGYISLYKEGHYKFMRSEIFYEIENQ